MLSQRRGAGLVVLWVQQVFDGRHRPHHTVVVTGRKFVQQRGDMVVRASVEPAGGQPALGRQPELELSAVRWQRPAGDQPLVEKDLENAAEVAGIKAEPPETLDAVGYSTSKGAVIQLTRDLAMKWGRYGIRVNALAPDFIGERWDTPAARAEVAEAAAFLARDGLPLLSGQTLLLDGMRSLRMTESRRL